MDNAKVYKTDDLNYKNGFVKCKCGYNHPLGDGFNGYYIESCPDCTPTLKTRNQRKVIFGKRNNLTVEIGKNIYFVLSNGIHIRYSSDIYRRYTGLSERKADKL